MGTRTSLFPGHCLTTRIGKGHAAAKEISQRAHRPALLPGCRLSRVYTGLPELGLLAPQLFTQLKPRSLPSPSGGSDSIIIHQAPTHPENSPAASWGPSREPGPAAQWAPEGVLCYVRAPDTAGPAAAGAGGSVEPFRSRQSCSRCFGKKRRAWCVSGREG